MALQIKFRCKICGYLYSRKDTLKDHIRGKHNARFSTQELNQLVETVTPITNAPNGHHNNNTISNGKKNNNAAAAAVAPVILAPATLPIPQPAPDTNGLMTNAAAVAQQQSKLEDPIAAVLNAAAATGDTPLQPVAAETNGQTAATDPKVENSGEVST